MIQLFSINNRFNLLFADVHKMKMMRIIFLRYIHYFYILTNTWFLNHMFGVIPVILFDIKQILSSLTFLSMWDADVDSSWRKYSMKLRKHRLDISSCAIPTDNCIKESFINDHVKVAIFYPRKVPCIHLFESQIGIWLFVLLLLKLDCWEADVNTRYMLESIFVHFFGHSAAPTSCN